MGTQNPIQPSFASGELSPALYSRVDISKYSSGLRRCRNFIIHPHGGASNRPGTKYVSETKDSTKTSRVIPFVFNNTQAYVLEFGDHYVRFYTNQIPVEANVPDAWNSTLAYAVNDYSTYASATWRSIQDGTNQQPDVSPTYWNEQTVYELYTPWAEADLTNLKYEGSADVLYLTHPDYPPYTLTRYAAAQWILAEYVSDDGPFMLDNVDDTLDLSVSAVTGDVTLSAGSDYFDALHVGALFKLKHYIEGQTVSTAFSSATTGSSIKCFTTWRLITHGTWSGKLNVEKSTDGGSTWTVIRTFTSASDTNVNTFGTEDVELNDHPFLVRINMYDYTSGTANVDLTTDAFYQIGIGRVTSYVSATEVGFHIIDEVGSTDWTYEWAEGSWSDYRGYPAVARFFQDRLCFAGTRSEPMTNWMTVTGNYTSFQRHAVLLDTDGISSNIPSRQINIISGLLALRKLVAFTSASEWTIGPVSGSALTPTTVEQLIQGYRGSYGVDPVVVGNEGIFVQANSKVIRNLGYQLAYDTYVGTDLNILARHLFYKYNIIDLAFQQDPDSIVWCLRDDGVLLGMTYMPEQEVVAWTWHDTGSVGDNPQGYIESICVIPGEGFDELWMIVRRGEYRFVEYMTKRLVESECTSGDKEQRLEDSYFVDCGVTFGETPIRITEIQLSTPIVVTAPLHGLVTSDLVKLKNISDPDASTLNGTSWIITRDDDNTFQLTTEQ